jgi:acyl-CoA thioesterase YciA
MPAMAQDTVKRFRDAPATRYNRETVRLVRASFAGKGYKMSDLPAKPRRAAPDAEALFLPSSMPALRVVPMPSDANMHGDVFGGWIMAHVDVAGSLPAIRRAGGRVATIAVNSFLFKEPVFVGDLLSFYAKVIRVGTTSVTVQVEVFAERNRQNAEVVKVTEAILTYVATDESRKPRPLPALSPGQNESFEEPGANPSEKEVGQ